MEKEPNTAAATAAAAASSKLLISFSASSKHSKPSKQALATAAAGGGGPTAGDGESKPQFVTEFDASQPLVPDAVKAVIAPIPNDGIYRRMGNISLPTADDDPSAAFAGEKFVLDTSTGDAPASDIAYGLTLRSGRAADPKLRKEDEEGRALRSGRSHGDDFMLKKFKEDMENLPEDRGLDEFKGMEVGDFGPALLKGYGWKEGQAIGRNKQMEDPKIFEYRKKTGTEGIGYNPTAGDPKKKRGEWITQEKGEKTVKRRTVRITSGRHMGLQGEILKDSGSSELILKLIGSGEEVKVGRDEVIEKGSAEEERFLRSLKKKDERVHARSRDEKNSSKRRKEEEKRHDDRPESSSNSYRDKGNTVRWLTSHIKVRIVSKDFMRGRLYLKKGEVIDVVGPTTCDISMDGNKELVQGVDQEVLETALPKRGGNVLVLFGKHKGVYGNLVERNTEDETGVVRDADNHALIKVRLEQIAEYTGDPSELGY